MSITINGATNTLTAASGLTIAGNVAATALNSTPIGGTTPAAGAFTTLSSTGTLGVGGAAAAWYIAGAASIGGWIDIGNGAGTATGSILSNAYAAGVADWRSRQGAFGSLRFDLNPDLQTFSWFTAPTVAINTALTWTQRMSLSTTGLAVTGALSATSQGSLGGALFWGGLGSGVYVNGNSGANTWEVVTNSAQRIQVSDTALTLGSGVNLVMAPSYIEGAEMTAPAAPAANGFRIFAEDNGAGKTRLMVQFATGAAQQLAIEP